MVPGLTVAGTLRLLNLMKRLIEARTRARDQTQRRAPDGWSRGTPAQRVNWGACMPVRAKQEEMLPSFADRIRAGGQHGQYFFFFSVFAINNKGMHRPNRTDEPKVQD